MTTSTNAATPKTSSYSKKNSPNKAGETKKVDAKVEDKKTSSIKTSPAVAAKKEEAKKPVPSGKKAEAPNSESGVKTETPYSADDSQNKESDSKEWVVNTTKFTEETEIKFASNPKRNGCASWSRYEKYGKAKTFGEYLKLNEGKFQLADARYDLSRKFLKLAADVAES